MTKIRELLLAGTMIPALLTAMPGWAATPAAGLWLMAQDASDPNKRPHPGGEAPQRGGRPEPAQRPAAPPPQAPAQRAAPPPAARAPEPAQRAAPAVAPQPRPAPAPAQRVAAPPPAARPVPPAPRIAAPPAPVVARPAPQPAAPPALQRQQARPAVQPGPATPPRPAVATPLVTTQAPAATAAPVRSRPLGQSVPPAAATAPGTPGQPPRPLVAAPNGAPATATAVPGQGRAAGQPLPPAAAGGHGNPGARPAIAAPTLAAPAPGQARPPGQPPAPATATAPGAPGQPPRPVVAAPNGTPPAGAPAQARPPGQPLPPAAATAPGAPGQPPRPPVAATGQPAPGTPPGPPAANAAPGTPGQPPQQQGNRGGRGAGIAAGAAVGFVGGFLASQGLNRLQDVQSQRQEFDDDGARVIREPGRTIIEDSDNRFFIAHDENERFRDLGYAVQSERRGDEVFDSYDSPDGSRVITVTDDNGRLLRRIRRFPDGRQIVLIDNGPPGPPLPLEQEIVVLPPPPIVIPEDRYIVESDQADEGLIYDALAAPPLAPLPRRYTLDQVRYSPDLRARMRSVDVDTITFPTGAWAVTPDQAGRLNAIGTAINRAIQRNPKEVFLIEGYTDAVGTPVDNLSLSDRRAQSVATILTQQFQVPPENLTTQGYGSQYPKVQTQGAEAANRRVTVQRITPLLAGNGQ